MPKNDLVISQAYAPKKNVPQSQLDTSTVHERLYMQLLLPWKHSKPSNLKKFSPYIVAAKKISLVSSGQAVGSPKK